jgi:hypothetical protein
MSVVNVEQYFSYMHDNNVGTIPLGGPVDGDDPLLLQFSEFMKKNAKKRHITRQ